MISSRLNFKNVVAIATCLSVTVFTSCGGESGNIGGEESAKIKMITKTTNEFGFLLTGSGVATVDWGDESQKDTLTLIELDLDVENRSTGAEGGVRFMHTYTTEAIRTVLITGDNITGIDVWGKNLTGLDVSKNTELIYFGCQEGNFTKLDFSKNKALKYLILSNNGLTGLDVSKNTALTSLSCEGEQLKSLDVSHNTVLKYLFCGNNQLKSLNVSKNKKLIWLKCNDNQLTASALKALFGTLHSNAFTIDELEYDDLFLGSQISGKTITIIANPGTATCDRSIAVRKGWIFNDK